MELTIKVRSGKGGEGCVSFHHGRHKPLGGPDGGDGGDGGSVFFIGAESLSSLDRLDQQDICKAEDGAPGSGNGKKGRNGKDLVVKIPIGVRICIGEKMIAKVTEKNQKILIAEGGKGGRGNRSLRSSTVRIPTEAKPGKYGELKEVVLKYDIEVDLVIIGKTNSGKSQFLTALTGAQPKISTVPFTSKFINIGYVEGDIKKAKIAELPSKHLSNYINHLKNSKIIVLLIDVSQVPLEQYQDLVGFLEKNQLINEKRIVVFNKIDKIPQPYPVVDNEECYYISALEEDGIDALREKILSYFNAS